MTEDWTRFDNFRKVVKSTADPVGFQHLRGLCHSDGISSVSTGFFILYLVPTRQRGNAVGNAPALRERDAGASILHSHAGAWEREITSNQRNMTMRLQTQINEQGMLTVPVPQSLRGKQVTILITPTPRYEDTSAVTAWQRTRQILRQTHELELPRKSHEEIISELRAFRESE